MLAARISIVEAFFSDLGELDWIVGEIDWTLGEPDRVGGARG